MGNQIISVVIQDEVMERVDRLARKRGVSRSRAVSEILADHFGMVTPQAKINRVMDRIEGHIQEAGVWQMLSKVKGSSIQCRTTVGYKYNPKVRFMLELSGREVDKLASLKIVSRTQNPLFHQHLKRFFQLIEQIESYDPVGFRMHSIRRGRFIMEGTRFVRDFHYDWLREELEVEAIARFLSGYMRMIREAMDVYFDSPELEDSLLIKRLYLVYRQHV